MKHKKRCKPKIVRTSSSCFRA